MSTVGQHERLAQREVLRFSQGELGYRYLGVWKRHSGNPRQFGKEGGP